MAVRLSDETPVLVRTSGNSMTARPSVGHSDEWRNQKPSNPIDIATLSTFIALVSHASQVKFSAIFYGTGASAVHADGGDPVFFHFCWHREWDFHPPQNQTVGPRIRDPRELFQTF